MNERFLILRNGYVIATAHNYDQAMDDWTKERKYNPDALVSVVRVRIEGSELSEVQNYMSSLPFTHPRRDGSV